MSAISRRFQPVLLIVAIFALAFTGLQAAQSKERAAVPDRDKWDMTQNNQTEQARRTAKEKLPADLPMIPELEGHLGESPQKLADPLELTSRLSKEFSRLYVYTSMMSDHDTRVS